MLEDRTGNLLRSRVAVPIHPSKIIDTGFTMDVGEMVVGTSRVRGEKAIIALLTAVPREVRK